MRKIQIVDLDGCISDDRWRRRHLPDVTAIGRANLRDSHFHLYHARCHQDPVANLDILRHGAEVVVMTSRPVAYRELTEAWLRFSARIRPLFLLQRNNGDHRTSLDIKRQQLEWLFTIYDVRLEEIISAFDDRDDIVRMYREAGISGARVIRIGEHEESYHG